MPDEAQWSRCMSIGIGRIIHCDRACWRYKSTLPIVTRRRICGVVLFNEAEEVKMMIHRCIIKKGIVVYFHIYIMLKFIQLQSQLCLISFVLIFSFFLCPFFSSDASSSFLLYRIGFFSMDVLLFNFMFFSYVIVLLSYNCLFDLSGRF